MPKKPPPSREDQLERAVTYICEHAKEEESGVIVARIFKRFHAYGLMLLPCAPSAGESRPGVVPVMWGEYHAAMGLLCHAYTDWDDITAEDAGESEASEPESEG